MRFTGQVRVPEVDHPGVPAIFVVEDDQAEVLLDGESLGRWSLFDVHASRLVSAAFSVSLAGDEITFIADEPVDFAYKGVDHMAESWARYKAMTLPRRMVAVGRSRRGTHPSRVAELRDAMLANLENQGRADWAQETEELEIAAPVIRATPPAPPPPPPVDVTPPVVVSAPPIEHSVEPIQAPIEHVETVPPVVEEEVTALDRSLPLRPGPGLVARAPSGTPPPPFAEVDPVDMFRPEPIEVVPVEVGPEPAIPVEEESEPIVPEPAPEVPPLVRELLDTSSEDDRDDTPQRLVVDLGAYEVPPAPDPRPVPSPTRPRTPALAAAAPVTDRSGIFGAVRAAFVRNRGSHEHEFVEAPGGIGITRHICNECGYISIGVSESDSE